MKRVFHYTLLLLSIASLCFFIYMAVVSVYPEPFCVALAMVFFSAVAIGAVIEEFKL